MLDSEIILGKGFVDIQVGIAVKKQLFNTKKLSFEQELRILGADFSFFFNIFIAPYFLLKFRRNAFRRRGSTNAGL